MRRLLRSKRQNGAGRPGLSGRPEHVAGEDAPPGSQRSPSALGRGPPVQGPRKSWRGGFETASASRALAPPGTHVLHPQPQVARVVGVAGRVEGACGSLQGEQQATGRAALGEGSLAPGGIAAERRWSARPSSARQGTAGHAPDPESQWVGPTTGSQRLFKGAVRAGQAPGGASPRDGPRPHLRSACTRAACSGPVSAAGRVAAARPPRLGCMFSLTTSTASMASLAPATMRLFWSYILNPDLRPGVSPSFSVPSA